MPQLLIKPLIRLILVANFGGNIIIGGDFNMNIESLVSKTHIPQDHSYNSYLRKMCDSMDLVDIWKLQNQDSVKYTRRENTLWFCAVKNRLFPNLIIFGIYNFIF